MLVKCENCEKLVKTYPSHVKILKHIFCDKKCRTEYRFLNKKNSKFFEKINTEEKAYWLGFICADGWMCSRDPSFGIGLSSVDKKHLMKFAELFDARMWEKDQKVQVQVYNPFLYEQLLNKGVVPNKSLINCLEVFDYIPYKLNNHFVRGWFDGDGSISTWGKYSSEFSITGAYGNLEKIQNMILQDIETLRITKILNSKNVFVVKWGGNSQLMDIRRWLYSDATIFLERKKEKFDTVVTSSGKGSSAYRGVYWSKKIKKWVANINHNRKTHYLGASVDEIIAAKMYNKALVDFGHSLNYRNIF